MVGRTDGDEANRTSSLIRLLLSIVAAVVVGVVVTIGVAITVLETGGSFVGAVVWSPLIGGFVTGVLSSRNRVVGTLTGVGAGAFVGVALLVGVVSVATNAAPPTGGAGIAVGITFLLFVVIGAGIVLLTAVGAFLGAVIRHEYETERDHDHDDPRA